MSQLLPMVTNAYPHPLQNLVTVTVYSIIRDCAGDYKKTDGYINNYRQFHFHL